MAALEGLSMTQQPNEQEETMKARIEQIAAVAVVIFAICAGIALIGWLYE